MEQATIKKLKIRFCPVRLAVTLLALAAAALIRIGRDSSRFMGAVYEHVTRPYHIFMSRLCAHVGFSVAELLYAAAAVFVAVYIIRGIILLIIRPQKLRRVYITILTLGMTAALVWAGFNVLWSPVYCVPSFSERSGINDGPVSAEALEAVTAYFAARADAYGEKVERDANGVFTADRNDILDRAAGVYEGVSDLFPFMDAAPLRPKPVFFSKVMSLLNFTGFFFPMTGEANLNMDSPACLLPATEEHELSHQRGIAEEQECNFLAVLACTESGDDDFNYSGALMAYIYLGNALYSADQGAWRDIYGTLSDGVRADLNDNSAYWAQYSNTTVRKASDKVYEAFLQSNGQTLGLRSYGACVDLLVNYYYDAAKAGS